MNLYFLMFFVLLEALAQDPREAEFLRQYREAVAQVLMPLAEDDRGRAMGQHIVSDHIQRIPKA